MKDTKAKVAPPNEELLKTEKESETNHSDSLVKEKENSIEFREKAVELRETAIEEREAAVELREKAVELRETAIEEREKKLDQKEKSLKSTKQDEKVPGLSFELFGEKKKFKDSAPKLIRYDGQVMTQRDIIDDADALLDLVSSNSSYFQNL